MIEKRTPPCLFVCLSVCQWVSLAQEPFVDHQIKTSHSKQEDSEQLDIGHIDHNTLSVLILSSDTRYDH